MVDWLLAIHIPCHVRSILHVAALTFEGIADVADLMRLFLRLLQLLLMHLLGCYIMYVVRRRLLLLMLHHRASAIAYVVAL